MRMKEGQGKTNSFQKDFYAITVIFSFIAILAFRIPFGYLSGNNGNAYFSAANEIFFVLAGAISYGFTEAVSVLVRYRVRREQFKSAHRVLKGALLAGAAAGLFFMLLFGLLGNVIASEIFASPLSGLAVRLMAPAFFFIIETGIFKGYFQGNGSRVPSMHSLILNVIFYISGGLIGASILHAYGNKVSALLQNDNYACSYGAMGASIGLLTASVFCFIHMLVLYFIYESRIKRQVGRENIRNQESPMHILHMLVGTGTQYAVSWFLFSCIPLVDQLCLYRINADMAGITEQWGAYYGKYLVILGLICMLSSLVWIAPIRRITILQERNDYRVARERLGILLHQCAAITIPAAVFLAVLAENFLDLLWNESNQQAADWLQMGSVIVVFFAFSIISMEILRKNKSNNWILLISGGALIVHVVLTILLLMNTTLGITALVIGNLVFWGVFAVAGFVLICRLFQYRQEWLHCFAITIVAAAVAGVMAMLLNKVFAPLIGNIFSLLICLPVAIASYVIILVAARGFKENEMYNMAGGKILHLMSGWFRFL